MYQEILNYLSKHYFPDKNTVYNNLPFTQYKWILEHWINIASDFTGTLADFKNVYKLRMKLIQPPNEGGNFLIVGDKVLCQYKV